MAAYQEFSSDDAEAQKRMRDMFGPEQVDQSIRQAISTCWMLMPADKKNPDAIAVEIRRIVERALANLKEDSDAFGFGESDGDTE